MKSALSYSLVALSLACCPLFGQSRLIFPRLSFEEAAITGLAVVNPTSIDAVVVFTAYGTDGEVIEADGFTNPSQREIPAGQQLSEVATSLFSGRLDPLTVGWVEATSAQRDLTGFFLALDNSVSFFDGADLPTESTEVVFPDVRMSGGFSTELNLVNPSDHDIEVALRLVSEAGSSSHQIEIVARGIVRLDVAELTAGTTPSGAPLSGSYVVASSDEAMAGFSWVQGPGDAFGLNAQPAGQFLNRLFFPQLAVLDPFITEVSVVNGSMETALVQISAHRADGQLFGSEAVQSNPVALVLAPGQSLREDIEGLFGFSGTETLEGWLEVETIEEAINGSVSYSIPASHSIAAVASVPSGHRRAIFSHIATSIGFFTGIAMLNPGALVANVRVVAVDPDGTLIGSFSTTLRPGQRISRLIDQLIPAAANKGGGLIWISSDVPIFLTSLFGNSTGVLANIPPQPVPDEYRPDQSPVFTIDPPLAVLTPSGMQGFGVSGAPAGMDWSVNGEPGGDEVLGMIDDSGTFTAPTTVTLQLPLTVTAQAGDQVSGASVDIISRQTLFSGLGVVQSVAYLQGLERLYTAELGQASSSALGQDPSQDLVTTVNDVTSGAARQIVLLEDDVSKIVGFQGIDGVEYLLLAGRASGTVLRLNPLTEDLAEVVAELNAPTSMVLNPVNGSLLVAEADRISTVGADRLNAGLLPGPGSFRRASGTPRLGTVDSISPRGIALNPCSGQILISDSATQSILALDPLTGGSSVLIPGLNAPGQLLGIFRSRVPCPSAFHLFVIEEGSDQVTLATLDNGLLIPWVQAQGVRDLTLLPDGSSVEGGGILTAQGADVAIGRVPGLYESQVFNAPSPPSFDECREVARFRDVGLEQAVRDALELDGNDPLVCARVAELGFLGASSRGIVHLDGIQALTGLRTLHLTQNTISDLSPLANLVSLEGLFLGFNQVENIDPLGGLERLGTLDLSLNQVVDLTPLSNLTALRILRMPANRASNLSPLSGLTGLGELQVSSNGVMDLGPLSALTGLTILHAGQNPIEDLSPLSGLVQLQTLDIRFAGVTSLAALAGMLDLMVLNANNNQISDLSPLSELDQLRTLSLPSNQISSIAPLVANPGLASGDTITLTSNLLDAGDCPDVSTLRSRGAMVFLDLGLCP